MEELVQRTTEKKRREYNAKRREMKKGESIPHCPPSQYSSTTLLDDLNRNARGRSGLGRRKEKKDTNARTEEDTFARWSFSISTVRILRDSEKGQLGSKERSSRTRVEETEERAREMKIKRKAGQRKIP